MMKKTNVFSLVVSGICVLSMLSGCGAPKPEIPSEGSASLPKGEVTYPIETDQTLDYWVELNSNAAQIVSTYNDLPFSHEEYKRTGIKINYIHPAQGQEGEKFNMLLASGNLPDIVVSNWYNISGGPEKMIKDNYILNLGDVIDDYAPNFGKLLYENPEVDKMIKTDEGSYYVFPTLKLDSQTTVYYGPMIRKDWLDDLGLSVPETIDDWHTVLTAFKEKKGADAPLSYAGRVMQDCGGFAGAYGVRQNFYVDDDSKIKYGPIEPGFKEFLLTANQWYKEGLIDKNLASVDTKAMDAKMLNGNTGMTFGFVSSSMGKWLSATTDENYDLAAVPYPVLERGQKPMFGQKDSPYAGSRSHAAISAKSNKKELAARFLDYAFSKEGNRFYCFGTEGESYTMVDGEPIFTDLILNNPDELPIAVALAKYTHGAFEGPFPTSAQAFMQTYTMPQQREALAVWADTNAEKHMLPRINNTAEESDELKGILTELTNFVDEKTIQFIMGVEPIENIDNFAEQIKSMNVDRAIELQQNALDRYNKR